MAKKLSVQIALEGAEQIQKDLKDIEKVGVEAWLKISKAAKEAGGFSQLKPEEITKILNDVGVTTEETISKINAALKKSVGFENLVKGIQSAENAIGRLTRAWTVFSRVLGPASVLGAAVAGFNAMTTATENLIVQLNNLAARSNVSIQTIDGMRRAFLAAGGTGEFFTQIFEKMQAGIDQIKTDKLARLAETQKDLEAAGWGKEAIAQHLNKQAAALDNMVPAGKNAADKVKEFAKQVAALQSNVARFAAVKRVLGIEPDQLRVDALVEFGKTVDQTSGKFVTFTEAQRKAAVANQKATLELSNAWSELGAVLGALGMGEAATKAVTFLVKIFTNGLAMIDNAFRQLGPMLGSVWATITSGAATAWGAIAAVVMPVVQQITTMWQIFFVGFQTGLILLQTGWQMIWAGMQIVATTVLGALQTAWQFLSTAVTTGLSLLQSGWTTVWQAIGSAATSVLDIVSAAWNDFVGAITAAAGMMASAFDGVMDVINSVIEGINVAWNELMRLLRVRGGGGGAPAAAAGGLMGHARGGLLRGRGTGTSDSNLAWVSRGEHIMPARAVRQPGVLAFLEALRRSGGNLTKVLDGMGRFALGGMVARSVPAFAGGGLVGGGMSNVTIQFPGLPEIGGLRAPSAVVDELRRAAAMAQVRSGGRKPSRYS